MVTPIPRLRSKILPHAHVLNHFIKTKKSDQTVVKISDFLCVCKFQIVLKNITVNEFDGPKSVELQCEIMKNFVLHVKHGIICVIILMDVTHGLLIWS